jgi:BON domain
MKFQVKFAHPGRVSRAICAEHSEIQAKLTLSIIALEQDGRCDHRTLFDHHPELEPPNSIQVQTLNHVVYLNGMVGEGLQSSEAESVALGAPGVTRVVNSITVTH